MYKRGDSWYSDFWYESKRYVKSWGQISKTVAKEKEAKFKTEVYEGKHAKKSKRILFETLAEKYIEYAELNKKPKTARRNKSSLSMLMPYFKGKLICNINSFMAEQFKKARKDDGKKPATINRDIDVLRNMMKKAVQWGYLSQNSLSGVKHLRENNEKMWVLTDEEEQKLLDECDKRPQRKAAKYLRDLVTVGLYSGMREDEIFNLKKDNVKLKERYIIVTDTKTEDRHVPINDTLYSVLERRLKDDTSDYVFYNSQKGKLTQLTNAFWFAIKEAGLIRYEGDEKIRFRFHDLRHTFGSRLGMAHTDLKTIMEIMGHKTHKMAMRYQHPTPDHKLNAVRLLDTLQKSEENVINLKLKNKLS